MKQDIVIVSVGSGDPDLLNCKTVQALRESHSLFLRTGRHPIATWLEQNHISFRTLDQLYDDADDFDQLNMRIAEYLLQESVSSEIVYAVSDLLTDRSVKALYAYCKSCDSFHPNISVIPGISISGTYLSLILPSFPDHTMISVSPAYEFLSFGYYDPNQSVLISELDNPVLAGQVKILLSETLEDEHKVFLISGPDKAECIPLYLMDRQKRIDHRTAVFVPGSGFRDRERFVIHDLSEITEILRSPDGCPWDKVQTHESLRPFLTEEAWECIASIDQHDTDHLCEELGDLLFQVVFHSSIGKSCGEFTLNDVITEICGKMIRRHPHVFGNKVLPDFDSVINLWEAVKQKENGRLKVTESFEDIPEGIPSLIYTSKILNKLSHTRAASERSASGILSDLRKRISNIRNPDSIDEDELGRLLLLCAELCFLSGKDSETLLHQTVFRLRKLLRNAEKNILQDGKSLEHLTFDELGVYLSHVEDEIE